MSQDPGEEAFFAARGFGRRMGFGRRPAVLSVDFLRAFTDPASPIGADLDAAVEQARRVLDAARAGGVPVFHSAIRYDDPGLEDAGLWRLKNEGVWQLRAGTPNVEVDARLGRRPEEQLVVKRFASAFFGTDLATRLVGAGVDTLVVVGCATSGCVRATAVDALQLGFRPMVVREAVGDRSAVSHERALIELDQKYADVVSADEVVGYLGSVLPDAR